MQPTITNLCNTGLLLLSLFALSPVSADTMKNEGTGAMMKKSQMDSSSHRPEMKGMNKGMPEAQGQMMHETMDKPKMDTRQDTAEKPMKKPMH